MNIGERRWLERIGVLLALLMSAGALALEIHQRLSGPPAPGNAPVAPPAAALGEDKLEPLPMQPGDKVLTSKGGQPITMQGFVEGRKQYEFTLDRLVLNQGENAATGEGARGAILGPDGKETVRFAADRATMDRVTQNLEIQGLVRVESTDPKNPVAFETRDMRWLAREEKLVCPNPVEVAQPGVSLRASRMTADVKLRKLVLEGGFQLEADSDEVKRRLESVPQGGGAAAATPPRAAGRGGR